MHVLGGIATLIVAMIHAFSLKFRYKEERKNRFELVLQYWHFVGVLWIYLLFFILNLYDISDGLKKPGGLAGRGALSNF